MKFGVVIFPGSNCDHDTYHVISKVIGQPVDFIWHKETDVDRFDAIILPGDFPTAIIFAAERLRGFHLSSRSVIEFANRGSGAGICNGFQILCESGLLPEHCSETGDQFICEHVNVRVDMTGTAFTSCYKVGQVLSLPIAHGEGNYFCDEKTLTELEREGRVLFRYSTAAGQITDEANRTVR